MPPAPHDLADLLGDDPLTRIELEWDVSTMRPEIVRLGFMLQAAGVEDPTAILDTIQSDVERLVMVRDDAPAQKLAGTLLMSALNKALRKAKADCHFEPVEGESAWELQRTSETEVRWPPWMVPELLSALLGLATVVSLAWLLFARGAYPWLLAYLALLIGSTAVSMKGRMSSSVPLRIGLSVVALGTSVLGVYGLYVSGGPKLAVGFTVAFAALHLAQFGLNAWKKSAAEPDPDPS